MSSPTTPKLIIKRRPSRSQSDMDIHAEPSRNDPAPQEPEEAHESRNTAAPHAAQPYYPAEDEESMQKPVSNNTDYDEPVPRADGEAMSPEVYNEEAAPPVSMKTARPKQAKAGKKVSAGQKAAAKNSEDVQKQPAASSPTPAKQKAKKPVCKVSILNVGKIKPVPEGVNTPRSVALCQQHGISPRALRPRTLADFKGMKIDDELAELRYTSYEKRRQAHMAVLLPKRQSQEGDVREAETARQQQGDTIVQNGDRRQPAKGEKRQPMEAHSDTDDETREMQRQFEEQHNRILEQERRQTANSATHRGSSPRATGRASSYAGTPPRFSQSSTSRGSGSGIPAGAAKIQSRCKVENRQPNEGERVIMDEIIERDLYKHEIRERQMMLEDNRKLMLIEQRLEKERSSASRVKKLNEEREQKIEQKHKERVSRDSTIIQRRAQMDAERMRKIEDDLAEKESRIHASDPYTSALSRRRYSSVSGERRNSARRSSSKAGVYDETESQQE